MPLDELDDMLLELELVPDIPPEPASPGSYVNV
jgi:hypothetical protein